MTLTPLLAGVAAGAAAATAACLAWRTGALEDEQARSARLEEELLAARRALAAAQAETPARGTHHRTQEETPHA